MKRTFDKGTAAGLLLGLVSIFGSFLLEGGQIGALLLLPAMVIVFGGTFATALIGNAMSDVASIGSMIKKSLLPPAFSAPETIDLIVNLSVRARKDGLLSLEREVASAEPPLVRKLLQFVIDGIEGTVLRSLAETEVTYETERNLRGAAVFTKMGGYSPTMGIIGTVMGLIQTLASAGDNPDQLIRHIASAFIATLWGVFMANLVWLPLADKLKSIGAREQLQNEMIVEGVLALQAGEVPSVIRSKLRSMIAPAVPENPGS